MKTLRLLTLAFVTIFGLSACNRTPPPKPDVPIGPPSARTMKAFASDAELKQYLKKLAENRKREDLDFQKENLSAAKAEPALSTGLFGIPESVTNTQHAGVDEGGIVKVHGNHLVVLRRGRLFTVAIGDDALTPVSKVNAFAPDMNPEGSWYDEMLVSDDTVAVIGYSYDRDGTEVGLFNIDAQGQLSYRSTYHLRSNDYYSSRNYASRLIGSKLIFYTPLHFYPETSDPIVALPAVRKWHKGAKVEEFQRIAPAERIYHPEGDFRVDYSVSLHTVTICDLANQGFDCQATTVIGPPSRSFYVSPDSVYVWASPWNFSEERSQPIVFRLPLDGSGPSALRVAGSPVDQFSFLQSEDQHLNVLVRSEAKGDGMWAAETAQGDVALVRIPISTFSDGSETVPATSYQQLPKPDGYPFQNRFVGDYLIYGTGNGWGYPETLKQPKDLFLVEWARGNSHKLELPHGIDRIEQMGRDALVVGTDGTNLHSRRFVWVRSLRSRRVTRARERRKVSYAVTASSSNPTARAAAHLVCPSACPVAQDITTCLSRRRRFCSCATSRCSFARLANSARSRRKPLTIVAVRRALTGTATRARCFCAGECLRCWVMNSWKGR